MNDTWLIILAGVVLDMPKPRPMSDWDHRDWQRVSETEVVE